LLLPLVCSLLIACPPARRGGGGDDDDTSDDDDVGPDDDDTSDDDDDTTDPLSISDLTGGAVGPGDVVTVDAVVTTPYWYDEDDDEALFWIQDDAGPGNGIQVFTDPDIVLELDLAPGDAVTVSGQFDDPFGFPFVAVSSADDVVATGQAPIPAPHPVSAFELADGFADADLYGVLVELEDLTVSVAGGWDTWLEWEADDVLFDSLFHYADVMPGYTVDSVVGVVHLDYGNAKVHPRWGDDVAFTHPGCSSASGDLQDVNCGGVSEGSTVGLEDLAVISPAPWFGDAFYVSDIDGDLFGGALVYSPSSLTPPPVGTVVSVDGEYAEYRGNTEIIIWDAADVLEVGGPVAVAPIPLTDACDIAEAHEGMLVTVPTVAVTQSADGETYGWYEIAACPDKQVGSDFFGSADFATSTPGGAGTITGLTGVVIDEFDVYGIHPRDTSDWDSWQ